MATVSERSREIATKAVFSADGNHVKTFDADSLSELIEQALLAERRLALEEAAKICDKLAEKAFGDTADDAGASYYDAMNDAAITVRAAEKEVGTK